MIVSIVQCCLDITVSCYHYTDFFNIADGEETKSTALCYTPGYSDCESEIATPSLPGLEACYS